MKASDRNHFELRTDGSSQPSNPGFIAGGYILSDVRGRRVEAKGVYGGRGTCNEGEYLGVIHGVQAALRHGADSLDIFADSMLIVQQIQGKWRVKAEHLREYHTRALVLLGQLRSWSIRWIPREKNQQADTLANNAAKFRREVDYSDRIILGSDERDPVYGRATRDQYRQRIRERQLQLRNVPR